MRTILLKSFVSISVLLTACTSKPVADLPMPKTTVFHNSLSGGGQIPLDIVQMSTGVNNVSYFRVRAYESSGGNKLYTWQSTAANGNQVVPQGYPGCPTYVPSPGAIWVSGRYDVGFCVIVTPSNDIYFQDGSPTNWVMLNTNGLKFLKIATRDFEIQSNGSSVNASGLLYGIGLNHLIYRFDTNSLTWAVQGSLQASDITVDPEGHPWVISYDGRSAGGYIYRGAAYKPYSGWVQYNSPTLATSISTSYDGPVTGILYTSSLYVSSGGAPAGILYWEPATTNPSQNAFQVVDPSQPASYTYVYGGDYNNQLWVVSNSYYKDVFRYDFTGL